MKIKKNFTTGVLSGICGILVLLLIMGSSTKHTNKNYGLVPLNNDGSINVSINNDQLDQLIETVQETLQIQQVQVVGYEHPELVNAAKAQEDAVTDEPATLPPPAGITDPEKEKARTTVSLAEIVNPLAAASPPVAPIAQPSWLNWNPAMSALLL